MIARTESPISLHRTGRFDSTVYAYKSPKCGGVWKVYPNPYHKPRCAFASKPPTR